MDGVTMCSHTNVSRVNPFTLNSHSQAASWRRSAYVANARDFVPECFFSRGQPNAVRPLSNARRKLRIHTLRHFFFLCVCLMECADGTLYGPQAVALHGEGASDQMRGAGVCISIRVCFVQVCVYVHVYFDSCAFAGFFRAALG